MELKNLQREWDRLGKVNALWAILNKRGRKWDLKEFFKTGQKEIRTIMSYISDLNLTFHAGKALDFGCGVGRLTQALVPYFNQVYGVDIAPSMIELANKYNKYDNRCKYILNKSSDLSLFPDNNFDFIYSNIVLQHIEPKYFLSYIREFLRILHPNGILIYQLPGKRRISVKTVIEKMTPKFLLSLYEKIMFGGVIEMYTFEKEKMIEFVQKNGGEIIDITENKVIGHRFINFMYFVKKLTKN